jgi:hypothetical protein
MNRLFLGVIVVIQCFDLDKSETLYYSSGFIFNNDYCRLILSNDDNNCRVTSNRMT